MHPSKLIDKARADYVSSYLSYRDISLKYNIPLDTVNTIGAREKWVDQRKAYTENVATKTAEKLACKEAGDLVDKLTPVREASDALAAICAKLLGDEDQFNRYVVTNGVGPGVTETEERIFKKADTKAIRDLSSSLKDLVSTLRNVYDLRTGAELEAQRIAGERLKLEQDKAKAQEQDSSTTIHLTFDGEDYGV